jgi:D-arabinose 1-dehydrogenase-like Zn-dependent alcohol dehydrogenase
MVYGTICAGTDRHILHDRLPWRMKYPLILGHESVGRVVEIGEKVRNLKPGDLIARVGAAPDPTGALHLGWGGFCESGFARDWQAMRDDGVVEKEWKSFRIHQVIPPDIAPEAGPLFITLRETLSYSNRLGIGAGTRLVIIGSGGNALAYVAHARQLGAASVAVLGAAYREDVFRAAGVTEYHDYRDPDAGKVLATTYPDGFHVAIDTVGKADSSDLLMPLLARDAVLGIYGLDESDRLILHPAKARGTFTVYGNGYDEAETHDAIVAGLREGAYKAEWWLGPGLPTWNLADIGEAFAAIESREAMKPLIRLTAED